MDGAALDRRADSLALAAALARSALRAARRDRGLACLGLVRTLGGLVGGLAVALGQVQAKKESGEIPAGQAPAAEASVTDSTS